MTASYLLGIDLGGGGGRCLLLNRETAETTTAYRAWRHPPAHAAGEWAYDMDTEMIWKITADLVQEVLGRAGASPDSVVGVAASGMRHAMVVIDEQGTPLLARSNQDARAAEQGFALAGAHGDEIYRRTGHWPSPVNPGAALIWMKAHMPEAFQRAHACLSISDWAGYKLTGRLAAEPAQAAETLLYDIHSGAGEATPGI